MAVTYTEADVRLYRSEGGMLVDEKINKTVENAKVTLLDGFAAVNKNGDTTIYSQRTIVSINPKSDPIQTENPII